MTPQQHITGRGLRYLQYRGASSALASSALRHGQECIFSVFDAFGIVGLIVVFAVVDSRLHTRAHSHSAQGHMHARHSAHKTPLSAYVHVLAPRGETRRPALRGGRAGRC